MEDEKLCIALGFINNNDFPLIDNDRYLPKNIGFNEYVSIIQFLINKEYIYSIENDLTFILTNVGIVNFGILQKNKAQEDADELAERNYIMNLYYLVGKEKLFGTYLLWVYLVVFIVELIYLVK
jgi:hypothetical protein